MADGTFTRPDLPAGFDGSRAASRAAAPDGWRLDDAARAGLWRAIEGRRDIRRFRPDPVPDEAVDVLLRAAHHAPSVGFMQPWRFVLVRSDAGRGAVHAIADRERLRQSARMGERARHFLEQKLEGIREAPLGIVVGCDHGDPAEEVLGRGTIPDTDAWSTACAIENLWLAARGEGLGIGWVSFYRPAELQAALGLPARVEPLAYLCVGWPDERPTRPGLQTAGWAPRTPLADLVFEERWEERTAGVQASASAVSAASCPSQEHDAALGGRWTPAVQALVDAVAPADHARAVAVRDRSDVLVKPPGALGGLERALERWAAGTGDVPAVPLRAGALVLCGDHAVAARGTSVWPRSASTDIAAAAARGETAIGVLARHAGHPLVVADLGLRGRAPAGVRAERVVDGARDIAEGEALTAEEGVRALLTGARLAAELLDAGAACLVLGEIGIGNTTAAAAVAAALLGLDAEQAVGRGTGVDAARLEAKRAAVARAIARHGAAGPRDPLDVLRRLGGAELCGLAGAMLAAGARAAPVLLDGFAVGVAALAAVRACPPLRDHLHAAHRSPERAHGAVLEELGLEPLLDLRLRLGEASGAALALPLLEQAAVLHRSMGTFAEAGVSPARPPR